MLMKSQRGFLLAEALIVATFIVSVLIFLFVQFKNLYSSYDENFDFNSVESLYALDNIRTYLKENTNETKKLSDQLNAAGKPYLVIYDGEKCSTSLSLRGTDYCQTLMEEQKIEKVIFAKADIKNGSDSLKAHLKKDTKDEFFSEKFKNFILRVNVKNLKHSYRLIAEFEDGSFATFNVGDENWTSAKYNDPDYVDPSYNDDATDESCFDTTGFSDGVEVIKYTCSHTEIKIPSHIGGKRVLSIGEAAFSDKGLTKAVIPPGVKEIKNSAFLDNALTSFIVPISVTSIGASAFKDNQITGKLIFSDYLEIISENAFANNKITEIQLGEKLEEIGSSAFFDNEITTLTLNKKIKTIGSSAFASNEISTLNLSESLITIGESAFENNKISSIEIPQNVISIGNRAFSETVDWNYIEIKGTNPYRFNASWTEIGWPISKINGTQIFAHKESAYEYDVKSDGYYKIDLWGASGSHAICNGKNYTLESSCAQGGNGAYTTGVAYLKAGTKLYFYVGGAAKATTIPTSGIVSSTGGYNGGGDGSWNQNNNEAAGGGGGATDVRINGTSLDDRIMVAGGGGGGAYTKRGGYGGDLWGGTTLGLYDSYPLTSAGFGRQTTGNAKGVGGSGTAKGLNSEDGNSGVGGGGGGYYGGKANNVDTASDTRNGPGGSSYISGYAGTNSVNSSGSHTNNTLHHSDVYFVNAQIINGASSMPDIGLSTTKIGNSGDGAARITYVGTTKPKTSSLLRNVRYIKDCTNGNEVGLKNHWTELQAIYEGVNIAKDKTATLSTSIDTSDGTGTVSTITDGKVDLATEFITLGSGEQCVSVDLGKEYNLEEIAVWHHFRYRRIYKDHKVLVAGSSKEYRSIYYKPVLDGPRENTNGFHIK